MARNDPVYPFAYRVGHKGKPFVSIMLLYNPLSHLEGRKDAKSFWNDASSFRLARFISVPFLQLVAEDDFLIYTTFKTRLGYSISNPNILVMETKCGGHLGWQQSAPGENSSWADTATADFISAAFEVYCRRSPKDVRVDSYFSTSEDRTRSSRSHFPVRSKL